MEIAVLNSALTVFFGYGIIYFILLKTVNEKQLRRITPLLLLLCVLIDVLISNFERPDMFILSIFILILLICVYNITAFSLIYDRPLKIRLVNVLTRRKGQTLEEIKETLSSKYILDDSLDHLKATNQISIMDQNFLIAHKDPKIFLLSSIIYALKSLLITSKD